ncbi:MAG: DUF1549 and DUF1553 domain-containing protein, partial [Pirellulaceae bacterium]|nr:DUF1549 and DUF1553 domain-containing protein [Pirellulaceae bacterium]
TSGTPSQQLVVRAHFTDGGARDVTDLAVFTAATEGPLGVAKDGRIEFSGTAEGAVLVRYLDIIQSIRLTYIEEDSAFEFKRPPVANFIDTHVFAKQKQLQLQPGRLAGDDEFLRRVYLDLVGGIPDPEEARRFIDSDDPRKRAKLVDQLLEREEYAQFWALKWADVMRGNREAITERGVHNFHRYMVHNLEADRPFDEVAREIISSVGDTINAPEANFYRISRTPDVAAESFSQLFLGVRIQCAKCHNHPYEDITQTDYFGLAAHFARVKTKGKRFGLDKEVVFLAPTGEVQVPGLEGDASPAAFRTPTADLVASEDRRDDLAHWLTAPGNEFFARSAVNRVWSHLMGLGVVEPIDDFRDSNPASSPELLDALAKEFADGGYRFKPIVRAIANSTTYQLSSKSRVEQSAQAAAEQRYFIRPVVKLLSAEQIIDAISMATGVPEEFPGYPRGAKAISLAEGEVEHKFLQAFAKPVRDVACDCARETDPTLNQVVHLINNPSILKKIESPENRIAAWRKAGLDVDELIANVYLATVTRRPSAKELSLAKRHLAENGEEVGLQDLQHALINANEFLLRH